MTTFLQQGPTGQGVASAAIAANVPVKWHTVAGQIAACGAGDIPIGVTMDAYASGALASFYRWGPGHEFYVAGAGISAGDYVKCTTAALAQEASATTVTAATVGQAKTASDSANCILVTATR